MSIDPQRATIIFIRIVKAHEWIYHPQKKISSDVEKRKKWSELVTTLKKYRLDIKDPKSKWHSLRDNFVRKHKSNKIHWPYFKEMEFLIPFISHKNDTKGSNIDNNSIDSSLSLNQSKVNNFPVNNFMEDDNAVMLMDLELDVVQEFNGGIIIDENSSLSANQQTGCLDHDKNEFQTFQPILETISNSATNISPPFPSLSSSSSLFSNLELEKLPSSSSSGSSLNSGPEFPFSKAALTPVSVSILTEKTDKRDCIGEKSLKRSKLTTKVVPPWDNFALTRKNKQNDQTERVLNALQNTSKDIKNVYSTLESYIALKSQLLQSKMKNYQSDQSGDGFFNIVKREFCSLSIEGQKNVFLKILEELELFSN